MNRFLMIALSLLIPTMASAQDSGRPSTPANQSQPIQSTPHRFSLTVSPLHLVLPIVELTGEYAIMNDLSAALILGGGKITSEASGLVAEETYTAYEVGAQGRYYLLGDFEHGMQVGAEALYLYLDRDGESSITVSGAGLALGPFIGYKIATHIGFTFDAQLGFQYMVARAEATDGTNTAKGEDSDILPLLNLNVGWSF